MVADIRADDADYRASSQPVSRLHAMVAADGGDTREGVMSCSRSQAAKPGPLCYCTV